MLVILSIKPKFADAIVNKEKTVEFRKAGFPKKADTVIIYSSNHVARIIGWFKIRNIVSLDPESAWRRYQKQGAIPKDKFDRYYRGAKEAVCIEIGEIHKIKPPIDPYITIKDFIPPQSFRYMMKPDYHGLINHIDHLKHIPLDSFSGRMH